MVVDYRDRVSYHYDGIYLPSEVASFLLVSMRLARRRPPSSRRILGWIRSGLVARDKRETSGKTLTINFEDLVTCQAITLLHEAGFSIQAIRRIEEYFSDLYGVPKPFAHAEFWHAHPHVYGRFHGQFITRAGPQTGQYALSFVERWIIPLRARLTFAKSTGTTTCWRPRNRITLRPDTQFGQPCIEGTRIPTGAIWGYVKGGDPIWYVAESFGLEAADVRRAFNWEEWRRAKLSAKAKIPA